MCWSKINSNTPENAVLETCIIEKGEIRNYQKLIKKGSLWFLPDMSFYVYYTPTHYRLVCES